MEIFSEVRAESGGDARYAWCKPELDRGRTQLEMGANVLGRWRRELRQEHVQAFPGHGRSRDEAVGQLRRELARGTKERDILREAAAFFTSAAR